ncbi:MAG: alpha/beta fold hydrolase [Corticimicrobacter sp.]|uniref:alpha/beta hydrolase n=1 Tax=Corticimicrobacter sp. TaxID=2678536 RepID=UPI0032DA6C12
MAIKTEYTTFNGAAGRIDCAIDWPESEPRGWALALHPHPLHGGARDNKVVTTLARACLMQGLVVVRPDFRGVGESEGEFDQARGETEDMQALVDQFRERYPALVAGKQVLAGFSFGTAVAAQLYSALAERDGAAPFDAVMLAGPAVSRFLFREVSLPDDTWLIHGEQDEVVPLAEAFDWARPLGLPVVVLPGAGHFFHGKLLVLRQLATRHLGWLWQP